MKHVKLFENWLNENAGAKISIKDIPVHKAHQTDMIELINALRKKHANKDVSGNNFLVKYKVDSDRYSYSQWNTMEVEATSAIEAGLIALSQVMTPIGDVEDEVERILVANDKKGIVKLNWLDDNSDSFDSKIERIS